MKPIHLIYVPGLNDRLDPGRRFFLGLWRVFGITTELVPMKWSDGFPYSEKFERLSDAIDNASGKRIVLLGESAGGSMVLNMYAARANALYKVMTICGKNSGPDSVSPHIYRKNPAYVTSMNRVGESVASLSGLQRRAFVSIHPISDSIVPIEQTLIPDCQERQLWCVGHFATIFFALSIASWYVVHTAKQQ